MSVPRWGGKRSFYTRRVIDQNRQTLYWKQGSRERVLLAPDHFSSGESLGLWSPSPDGEYLAYSVLRSKTRDGVLRVRHVFSGRETTPPVAWRADADLGWAADNRTLQLIPFAEHDRLKLGDKIVSVSMREAASQLEILSAHSGFRLHPVTLPVAGRITHLEPQGQPQTAAFHLESFVMPPTVCQLSLETGVASCGGAFDRHPGAKLVTETLSYLSVDGRLPLIVVRPPGYIDPAQVRVWIPTYDESIWPTTPVYSEAVQAWVEAGGWFAFALDATDAAAAYLVQRGYATPDRIVQFPTRAVSRQEWVEVLTELDRRLPVPSP